LVIDLVVSTYSILSLRFVNVLLVGSIIIIITVNDVGED
jgi:hypothetical protein